MSNRRSLPDLGVRALLAAYAEGALTPVDVAETVVDRIAARGDDHAWITLVDADDLREQARALAARPDRPPLYGIPFAVKDNIDVAGLPTTAGCPDFAYRPDRTAEVVTRLLDAGALLVGKTNLDQFATGLTGTRSPYGACGSVFGGGLISGGSSSGSAVAVASGTVSFALGTDTAGSGRVPAALNGIVGLKPTRGLLSTAGVVPACRSLDCVSVFTTGAADAAAVFDVARGPSTTDPWSRSARLAARDPSALRLGVPAGAVDADPGQLARFAHGRERLAALVGTVEPVDLAPFLAAGDLLYGGPWVAERLAAVGDFLDAHPSSVLPVTRAVLESGRRFSAVDGFRATHRLRELRAEVDRVWERVDVLVLPTVGTTFTHAEIADDPIGRNATLGRFTQFANLLDLAVVSVPNGFTADGRPASLSLVGPAFSDLTLLALADPSPAAPAPGPAGTHTTIAVVGRHLSGEPANGELLDRGATLVGAARTAPLYRLYHLTGRGGLPALVRTTGPGASIDVELWRLPATALGGLLAGVPEPLSLGWLRLADGSRVLGFLGEAYATGDAEDISASGGWKAFRAGAPV